MMVNSESKDTLMGLLGKLSIESLSDKLERYSAYSPRHHRSSTPESSVYNTTTTEFYTPSTHQATPRRHYTTPYTTAGTPDNIYGTPGQYSTPLHYYGTPTASTNNTTEFFEMDTMQVGLDGSYIEDGLYYDQSLDYAVDLDNIWNQKNNKKTQRHKQNNQQQYTSYTNSYSGSGGYSWSTWTATPTNATTEFQLPISQEKSTTNNNSGVGGGSLINSTASSSGTSLAGSSASGSPPTKEEEEGLSASLELYQLPMFTPPALESYHASLEQWKATKIILRKAVPSAS